MQANFKSLIACSTFPFHHIASLESLYSRASSEKVFHLGPTWCPSVWLQCSDESCTLDTKSSRVLFQTLLCSTTKFAHIMWTYKLVGIRKIVGCDDEAKKKKDLFFSLSFSFHGRRCSSEATRSAFADTNFGSTFWSHTFWCRRKSPAEKEYDEEKRKKSQSHTHLLFPILQEDSVYPFQSKATEKTFGNSFWFC
jgi:hypothetical protein